MNLHWRPILAFVFLLAPALPFDGQDTKSVGLRSESHSFNISSGSSFSASGKAAARPAASTPVNNAITGDLDEALEIIRRNYGGSREPAGEAVVYSTVNGMLRALDPHSSFYTKKEFLSLNDEHRGRYFGIGMTISNFTENGQTGVFVLSVLKNAPAERAGLRFSDHIVLVDGVDVSSFESTKVRDLVRGPEGSEVRLTVERSGERSSRTFTVRRAKVAEPSIPAAFITEGSIAYIALTEGFNYTTVSEFDTAYETLRRKGMQSLIVDLRGNGGGVMGQAIRIAEKFLPPGRVIVSQHGRYPAEDRIWKANSPRWENIPLVILVDENTASASEIFAAAMQDNDRATIVGSRTFGKGLVQDVIPLDDGSGLVLTSERYCAPSGRSLQRYYSDTGLYDYFRHVNQGTLIDQPSFATRTLKGRVVYGGDGIQPDILAPAKIWTLKDLANYEKAFFIARKFRTGTSPSLDSSISRHFRWFQAIAAGDNNAAAELALENDPQARAAIVEALRVRPQKEKSPQQ